jgi:hypothetical protein
MMKMNERAQNLLLIDQHLPSRCCVGPQIYEILWSDEKLQKMAFTTIRVGITPLILRLARLFNYH